MRIINWLTQIMERIPEGFDTGLSGGRLGGFAPGPIRRLLGTHAFTSTLFTEVRNEFIQQEITNTITHANNLVTQFPNTVNTWLHDYHILYHIGLAIVVFCGAEVYNTPSLKKLREIAEYECMKRTLRVGIITFLVFFFRVVEPTQGTYGSP